MIFKASECWLSKVLPRGVWQSFVISDKQNSFLVLSYGQMARLGYFNPIICI